MRKMKSISRAMRRKQKLNGESINQVLSLSVAAEAVTRVQSPRNSL